jgi:uncharacterized protein involved in exopolysaccharide biosynthesis
MTNRDFKFIDIVIILARWKKSFLLIVGSITILSLIIALIWPKQYQSKTEFIYNKPSSGSVSGILNSFIPMGGSSSSLGPEQAIVILKSADLKKHLTEKYNLYEYYEAEFKEALYRMINSRTIIESNREGGFGFNPIISITMTYEDKNPQMANNIVETSMHYLDSVIVDLNANANAKSFSLVEDQYKKNQIALESAEQALNDFQNHYGILEVDAQIQELVKAIAEVRKRSIELSIQIAYLENVSDESYKLKELQQRKSSFDEKYNELIRKNDNQLSKSKNDISYSLLDYPDLMLQYGRLYRDVEVQNKIYEYIYPLYLRNKAQIDDNYSGIQLIDPPSMPTYKSSPKRAIIVLGGFLFSVFLAVFYIAFRHLLITNEDYHNKVTELKHELFGK